MIIRKSLGLGFSGLENKLSLAVLENHGKNSGGRGDCLLERLHDINHIEGIIARLARLVGVAHVNSLAGVNSRREQLKAEESREWARLQSQGRKVRDFRNDPIGNAWLRSDRREIRWYGRGDPNVELKYRRCSHPYESLGHVLGECVAGKGARIHRQRDRSSPRYLAVDLGT